MIVRRKRYKLGYREVSCMIESGRLLVCSWQLLVVRVGLDFRKREAAKVGFVDNYVEKESKKVLIETS